MAIKIDDDGGDENNSPVAVIKASSKPTNNKHYDVRLVTLSCYVRVCVCAGVRVQTKWIRKMKKERN